MSNHKFSAALFDMDDTLIGREAAYGDVYRALYDRHEVIHSTTSWPDALDFFWSLSTGNMTNPREAFLEIKKKWPTITGDPDSHNTFYFEQMVKLVQIIPGAMDFIDWMNSSSVNWGVVTNGDQFQHLKAEASGIDKKAPFVLASKLFGVDKPEPQVFMEAVRLLDVEGLETEEILFVGDNPYTDIIGAHGVGMKTAWVRMGREYPNDAPAPDFIIDHVAELKEHLG
jgi:putative hydrolase of the HAD superfamily